MAIFADLKFLNYDSDPTNTDVRVRCIFAHELSPSAILQFLGLARKKAADMTRIEGPNGHLPGETGTFTQIGSLGAEFEISGIAPHRLTWQIMSGAVDGVKTRLREVLLAREAQCSTIVGDQIVGTIGVRGKEVRVEQS